MKDAKYLQVEAEVRYWEDAEVNGEPDTFGDLMPLRDGALWKPTIRLQDGVILSWPEGTTALVHYKVCDQGMYYLLDQDKTQIARWRDDYVPNSFLCHGDNGFGDYIIFNVDEAGHIEGWSCPEITIEQWQPYVVEETVT